MKVSAPSKMAENEYYMGSRRDWSENSLPFLGIFIQKGILGKRQCPDWQDFTGKVLVYRNQGMY